MVKRDLDGIYYRVKRGEKWVNRCFTDLTVKEQMEIVGGYNDEQLRILVYHLASAIRTIGDIYDLVMNDEEDFE